MPAGLVLLVLAQVTLAPVARQDGSAGSGDLTAIAASSPRPPECRAEMGVRASPRAGRSRIWSGLRRPELKHYCGALARGYATLERDPAAALTAAEQAERTVPGRAAPLVLTARALSAQGKHAEAWERFSRALALDRRALEAPHGLLALARTASASGHAEAALRAYRALVPRARMIEKAGIRISVYVEAAAAASMRGAEGLTEAMGYLSEARRQVTTPGAAPLVLGAYALTLDRQGRHQEAVAVVQEAGGGFERPTGAAAPALPPGELEAIEAMLAEGESALLARDRWQASIALRPAIDPWLKHAQRSLARLGKAAGPREGG